MADESRRTNKGKTLAEEILEQEKARELVTWVHEEYAKCKEARQNIERQWHLNMHFMVGKQYVEQLTGGNANGVAGKLITPKAPPWRTRLVVNRVRSVIRTEIARLTSQKPNASVVPASSEDQDLFAAQAGEQIWESLYSTKKLHREYRRTAYWQTVTGNGFLKCWWDKEAVDKLSKLKGDIAVRPVTPFHIFVPDLREEEIENQPYVMNVYTRPANVVKEQFGDLVGDLQGSVVSSNEIIDDANLNLTASTRQPDSVLIYEVWLKPGAYKEFPLGGLVQVVDKYVVNVIDTGIPYAHGEYPFIHFTHIPTGNFYAASVIEDIISLQREYNRTRSQLIEAKNRTAKPQLMAPLGSIDPSKMTTEPGQVILYRPGMAPPTPLPIQPVPNYVLQELERILADIEDITAQHQVSKGSAPAGVTAATAISYLQERDDTVLSPSYASVEEGYEKLARHVLSHVVQYWDQERTVKVAGDDGAFDTLVLRGADIASGTDIRMEGGSALPVSKAARQAFLMDLLDRGAIPPDQGLRLMDMGGMKSLYDELAIDQRQAQRENLKMKLIEEDLILQWESQRDQAAAFATQAQMMMGSDPTAQGLPGDFPPLPPDLAAQNGDPNQPSMNDPAAQADPNAPIDPINPPDPNTDPAAMAMDPMASMGPPPPITNPNGTVQSPNNLDPETGLPLDMPLLVPVNTWDNHPVHIEIHNRFRKGQAFEKLSDAHKRLFEAHVALHAEALNSASMAAGAMGMPPEGMPAGPGTPPSPGGGANQFSPPGGM
jgi:hypothetical protein